MSTSISGLTPPTAAWCVNQHNGGADVTIFIREDSKDLLPTLNTKVQSLFPGMSPQLRIKCSVLQSNNRGRAIRNSPLQSIFLNDQVPVIPRAAPLRQRTSMGTISTAQTSPTPPPGSWAAALMNGAKRLPVLPTLDHRPKKKKSATIGAVSNVHQGQQPQQVLRQQQNQPRTLLPSPASPVTASTTAGRVVTNFEQTTAWQELIARNASMEKRLTEMQTASTTLLDSLTRNIESLAAQLTEQRRHVDASIAAMATMTTHFDEQFRVNASLRDTLEQIAHRLQITPLLPQASAAALPNHSATASSNAVTVAPQLHLPGSGAASASNASTMTSSTATHAAANPARNGSAQRHG